MVRLADLERLDLPAILRGLVSWDLLARLDRELPAHLTLPHGKAQVDYTGKCSDRRGAAIRN